MSNNLKHISPQVAQIGEKIRKQTSIPETETFGSVMAVLMIISIILTVIRIIQECNKTKLSNNITAHDKYELYGAEMRYFAMKRGWFTKMRLKRLIKQQMSKEQFEKYGLSLLAAMLDTGEKLKDEEVISLVEAANV